jgi:NADPH:quinone reductase-like Zn-dependent oxidoreductase
VLAVVAVEGNVEVQERPDPEPGTGEILVRVRAAGLNGADLLQRAGRYPPPDAVALDRLGLELAGVVEACGPVVTRFAPGDAVMGLVTGGGQAELVVLHERLAMPVPPGTPWPVAGGFAEVFTTAHDALVTQCGLRSGDRLLVNGAAGGVGTAAVQVGVQLGAGVVASVRALELRGALAELGAEAVAPEEAHERGPFDVVLELVGAPNLSANLQALATGGRIAIIGTGAGARAEIDLGRLMVARAVLRGSTLRARPLEEKALAARLVEHQVVPLLAAGRIQVPLAATFPLAEAAAAYDRFAAGAKLGKIVLTLGG